MLHCPINQTAAIISVRLSASGKKRRTRSTARPMNGAASSLMSFRNTAVGRTASQLNMRIVPAEFVARQERPQLVANELAQRLLARHRLHLLRVGELLLGERAERRAQYFAVQPVLAGEVVVDGGLIDARLGDDGAHAGRLVAAVGEQPLRRLEMRSRVISDGRVIPGFFKPKPFQTQPSNPSLFQTFV